MNATNSNDFAANYDLIARVIASRLRRRIAPAKLEEAIQTATVHAWTAWAKLAETHADTPPVERARIAAYRGSLRATRRVSTETRAKHYRDALDYVSPDEDLYHVPSQGHAGRVSQYRLSTAEATALDPAERDAMIGQLPARLRPYATLAAQGVTQRAIADRRGESRETTVRRMRAVRAAIRELAEARRAEADVAAWLADGLTESPDATQAEREAIRECDQHASLVVTTDRTPARDRAIPDGPSNLSRMEWRCPAYDHATQPSYLGPATVLAVVPRALCLRDRQTIAWIIDTCRSRDSAAAVRWDAQRS